MTTDGDIKTTETPSRGDYRASVSSGLKRLESEKLPFLRPQSIVSKFNQSHVAQYSRPKDPNSDKTVPDALYRLNAPSQAITTRFSKPTPPNKSSISHVNTAVAPTGTQRDILSQKTLTKTGNIVADEVDNLKKQKPTPNSLVTLNYADIRAKSSTELEAVHPSSLMPEQDDLEKHPSQARIFIPASIANSAASSQSNASAINKLRAQGLFETLVNAPQKSVPNLPSQNTKRSISNTAVDIPPRRSNSHTIPKPVIHLSQPQNNELSYPAAGWQLITDGDEDDDDFTIDFEDDLSPLLEPSDKLHTLVETKEPPPQVSPQKKPITKPHPIITPAQQPVQPKETKSLAQETTPKKLGTAKKIAIVFAVIIALGVMTALAMAFVTRINVVQPQFKYDELPNLPPETISDIDQNTNEETPKEPDKITQDAIQQAVSLFSESFDIDQWYDAELQSKLSMENTDQETKTKLLQEAMMLYPENTEYATSYADILLSSGKIKETRAFCNRLPNSISSDPNIRDIYFQSFAQDKHFMGPIFEINEDNCDEIAPLGGGSTLTFKFYKNKKISGAFKPYQTRRQSNYRAEIAAWRLCELLQCDFSIPYNKPIKIERDTFFRLYDKNNSPKKDAYRKELVDLIWSEERNKSYVYGTLKDWVPDFTRFPIELNTMWMPWLSQKDYMRKFPSLKNAIYELNLRANTSRLYQAIIARAPDLKTEQLASQISQVLTFDFLIGNWDRFSGVPEWWGVNCQFKDNKIVSIDNGASFPTYCNEKVQERFLMTERFSAHFIYALRRLNKDQTFTMLFPNPSSRESAAFEQFWNQRSAVLARIDSLSQIYGSDRVLSFE